jgi:CheY-like chemotaxis protein
MDTHAENLAALSVLVVEDDADTVDSYVELLTLYGCAVRSARCGDDALALAEADPPDVVLLDIRMPKMDGWELACRLRRREWVKPPLLIAVSGYCQPADLRHSSDVGIHLHLVKPADPALLLGVLRRCVGAVTSPDVVCGRLE